MNKDIHLPNEIEIGRGTISCFFINAISPIANIEEARIYLKNSPLFRTVKYDVRDPNFFNPAYLKDPLMVILNQGNVIEKLIVNQSTLKGHLNDQKFYKRMLSQGKNNLFKDVVFTEKLRIFENGVLIYIITFDISKELSIDDIIFFTNSIVKLQPIIKTKNSQSFELIAKIRTTFERLSLYLEKKQQTKYIESYSVIQIDQFSENIEKVLSEYPSLRLKLYETYENQIHALSVRTIEEWRERFPPGVQFPDKNVVTSSVGIIRINFRNTLIYEFPYSESTIENLYIFAIVELKAWDFLIDFYLAESQKLIDNYAHKQIGIKDIQEVEQKRYEILDAVDDFSGYTMATSFRTRNFYNQAIKILQIDKLTEALQQRISTLENIVNHQYDSEEREKQSKILNLETKTLEKSYQILNSQEVTSIALIIMNVFMAAAVSLTIVQVLKMPKLGIGAFLALVVVFLKVVRYTQNLVYKKSILISNSFVCDIPLNKDDIAQQILVGYALYAQNRKTTGLELSNNHICWQEIVRKKSLKSFLSGIICEEHIDFKIKFDRDRIKEVAIDYSNNFPSIINTQTKWEELLISKIKQLFKYFKGIDQKDIKFSIVSF